MATAIAECDHFGTALSRWAIVTYQCVSGWRNCLNTRTRDSVHGDQDHHLARHVGVWKRDVRK